MFQPFPFHSLLIEDLRPSSATAVEEGGGITHLCGVLRVVHSVYLDASDANVQSLTLEGPSVYISGTPRVDRLIRDDQMKGRKYTRRWQPRSGAAYATELIQAHPERRTCRIESVQSLQQLQRGTRK